MDATFGGDQNMFARVVTYLEPDLKLHDEDRVEDASSVSKAFSTEASKMSAAAVFEWPNLPDGILPVGDSITVGFLRESNGGDGDGYRRKLRDNLSKNEVIFAGTETRGTMSGGYFAAWSGKTIKYISNHVGPSLEQQPNIILLATGTNNINPNTNIATKGNNPLPTTKQFQKLILDLAKDRRSKGKHILTVDFITFSTNNLIDCIHPTNDGYKIIDWIKNPVGPDPDNSNADSNKNGGIDNNIPAPGWGESPVRAYGKDTVKDALSFATGGQDTSARCPGNPEWRGAGMIALGSIGSNGDWHYNKNWQDAGEVAVGIGRENRYVRLHDMNDYVWIHPTSGEIRCWINNLSAPWSPAGNNGDIIGSGAGPSKAVYLADMNGDGMDDYMVVNENDGSVRIWWNYGPDENWVNGWKFVDGGEIASGVPHANLKTLRFPDINGDGRADYVYIGEGGSLKHHMNTGRPGQQDLLFHAMGGIATGAVGDISKLVFADIRRKISCFMYGRDDYLIWDDEGGLTGFLNQKTNREGVPRYINQGPAKTIADGIHENPSTIRLADMDGDGKDDYVFIGDNVSLRVLYNRGDTNDNLRVDGIHFADMDGDGKDDYVWLDSHSGAPTVFDSLGWKWNPVNGGRPIASGVGPSSQVAFGDIDGDGLDDYIHLDPKTGALSAFLNPGAQDLQNFGWRFNPIGEIPTGLGPGHRVRIADIDGDGRDDYIFLKDNGGTIIYRNIYSPSNAGNKYTQLSEANASGIGQSPDEIDFVNINGNGKADYLPAWRDGGEIAGGVGTSGANVKYGALTTSGRADYVAIDTNDGSIAAWNEKYCYNSGKTSDHGKIEEAAKSFCGNLGDDKSGPVFSDFYKESKKQPPGDFHFVVSFEVFKGCEWTFDFDECMRYYKVPIDSCNCSGENGKQGGYVRNNCIQSRIDPNSGT
ncbi:hypothetical protein B0I35DRAFT_452195 [Stachybotrys elegans]|uniref:SGNH hydrolase-type esterase domain-containing protein n=1 Tax=Stachybotrys elegans TaxID=80388 RepID=A0A8K0WQQ1_9HYPO|nr:hypothetical protein B0I35DRAFT_452195 [Stachybotrys elegans]